MIGYYYYLSKIRPYFVQPEKSDYTLLLFSLLTVLVFGFLGILPLSAKTLEAFTQLREGERYETELAQKIVALNQAGAAFFSAPEISQLGAIIPEGNAQPQILQALDNDAAASGMVLKGVVFRTSEQTPSPGEIGSYVFDFFAEGPERTANAFFKALEQGQLIQLELVQTARRTESGGVRLEISGRGRAFYLQ